MFFHKSSETLILFSTPFLHLLAHSILELIPQAISGSLVMWLGITSGGGCRRRSCGLEPVLIGVPNWCGKLGGSAKKSHGAPCHCSSSGSG